MGEVAYWVGEGAYWVGEVAYWERMADTHRQLQTLVSSPDLLY